MAKIAVLGLGESLKLYNGAEDFTVGVNDIWAQVQADYIVCVDERSRFTPARLAVIDDSYPIKFYSHLDCWAGRDDFSRIALQEAYPDYVCQLDTPKLPMSMCSPFVATALAYKILGATEVHIYGVDLLTHWHLKDKTADKIVQHFKALKVALIQHGCGFVVHGNGRLKVL